MRYVVLLAVLFAVPVCHRMAPADPTAPVRTIGAAYLKEHNPDWLREEQAEGHLEVVLDRGEYWEYTFTLPPNKAGGVPVVEIDKRRLVVIRAYHTQ